MTDNLLAVVQEMYPSEDVISVHEEELPEGVADTSQLQFQELQRFASDLGFFFDGVSFQRESGNPLLKAVTTLGFNTMVRIYGLEVVSPVPSLAYAGKYGFVLFDYCARDSFNMIPFYKTDLLEALESRQLKRIKLQITKKGVLKVLSHKVEFTSPGAGEEFANLVASMDDVQ